MSNCINCSYDNDYPLENILNVYEISLGGKYYGDTLKFFIIKAID